MDRATHRNWQRVAAVTGVLVCTMMSTIIPGSTVSAAPKAGPRVANATTSMEIGTNGKVSASISQTQNLQPRQNVTLSWSGAMPTSNYSVIDVPTVPNYDEYPVDIMECWGTDSANAPMDPTHCFGSTTSAITPATVYTDTMDSTHGNPPAVKFGPLTYYLGFNAVDGTHYNMYNGDIPKDFLASAGIQPNFDYAWSDANGARQNLQFEVRTIQQYPSLGCSDKQACTIEVVPITNPYCKAGAAVNCTKGALNPVGTGSTTNINNYIRANDYWLTSEWKNRISFGITIAPQLSECSTNDTRSPVPVAGSELAYNAMLSWVPDFCLDPKSFNLSYVGLSEPRARTLLSTNDPGQASGYSVDAALSSLPVTGSPRPVVHAPVAVTGFAVSFLVDNGQHTQITSLNLTPLLLAKLITDSYPGPTNLISEPVIDGNPGTIWTDPEFLAINPGFTIANNIYTGMNMIMPAGGDQWDAIWSMTSYINADPEARAWLNGTPDAYSGMIVNPVYRGMTLPELATAMLDTYTEPTTNGLVGACEKVSPTPDQLLYEQISNGLIDAAQNWMLNRQSPATAFCSTDQITQWSKYIPQGVGSRALLALTSVPVAGEYGLPVANLQVHKLAGGQRLFAAPTATNMAAALAYATEDTATGVLSLDYPHLAANAYPGTMPVYAVVPTHGLTATEAKDYAGFLTFAATTGQVPGTGNGNLPAGYSPLTGALSALSAYTLKVATDVAKQDGAVPAPPATLGATIGAGLGISPPAGTGSSDFSGASDSGGSGGVGGAGANATGGPGSGAAGATSTAPSTVAGQPQTVAMTRGTPSWLADWGLPILLGLGLLAGIGVPFVRLAAQPGHPVRIFLARVGGAVAHALSRRG